MAKGRGVGGRDGREGDLSIRITKSRAVRDGHSFENGISIATAKFES